MGRSLVIKGVNFSSVAVEQVQLNVDVYQAKTVQGANAGTTGEDVSSTTRLRTGFFELTGDPVTLVAKSDKYNDILISQVIIYNTNKSVSGYNVPNNASSITYTGTIGNGAIAAGKFIKVNFKRSGNTTIQNDEIYIDSQSSSGIKFTSDNSYVIPSD